jgi:hypothetical protein
MPTTATREIISEMALQNAPKKFLRTELQYEMKMSAWECAENIADGYGTSPKSVGGGARSARNDGQCGCGAARGLNTPI